MFSVPEFKVVFITVGSCVKLGVDADVAGGEMKERIKTGFVYDERFLDHDTGEKHPESKERLRRIYTRLKERGLLTLLREIPVKPANQRWIEAVHSIHYIRKFEDSCLYGLPDFEHPDNVICRDSFDVALLATGGVLAAVDAVMKNEVLRAFCAIRPPGHHAECSKPMGFCYFNNIAVGARYLLSEYGAEYGIERVAIIDFDAHHGNGVQHIFEQEDAVFYYSIHEHPSFAYPGTGRDFEIGKGRGEGYTLNSPILPGRGDAEYQQSIQRDLLPAMEKFRPDFLFVSAGFDAHKEDLMADIKLSSAGFDFLSETMVALAEKFTEGRIVSVLEGGYNLETLAKLVENHIRILAGYPV